MASLLQTIPPVSDFFPPTPDVFGMLETGFRWLPLFTVVQWTPISKYTYMGKTSTESRFNLPGRIAWSAGELVGPLNLLFIIYTLPIRLQPVPDASSSILGTGLPLEHELLAALYLLHYVNRAVVTPLFLAPSMSPIHLFVLCFMVAFQYTNSACIACWLCYSTLPTTTTTTERPTFPTLPAVLALLVFFGGLAGNILSENALFELRRGAARRKAKSEGRAVVTYDKVYAIPPAQGWFRWILFPHYVTEWAEWTGYWLLAGVLGLGWVTPAMTFLVNELVTMTPRAVSGKKWYLDRFGKRSVAGRGAVVPLGLL